MLTRSGVCAVALTVLLAAPAAASAKAGTAGWRTESTGVEQQVRSDGVRYVATRAADGSTAVYDETTRKVRRLSTPSCEYDFTQVVLGAGRLLWGCTRRGPYRNPI